MAQRHQIIEIFAPTLGRKHDAPPTMLDLRAQPDGGNATMFYGSNQKSPGTTIFATGTTPTVTNSASLIFDAKFPSSSSLQVLTKLNVFKYTSGLDSFVSDGQTFSAGATDMWSGFMYNDQFYYSNGIDPIQIKATVSATGTNWASAISPDTYKAWSIAALNEHMNLYHTVENGTEFFKRVRWTTRGAMPATTAFGTGLAGAIDLVEAEGEIKQAVSLGIVNAIYAERSIHVQNWVGGDEVFRFTKTISGIGTPSRRGALAIDDVNYFIGHNNFYAYYGGTDLRPIGDPISKFAFSQINRAALASAFVSYDQVEDEVSFHVPITTATSPNLVWVFRRDNESWIPRDRPYTAKGSSTRRDSITIGDLVGGIGEQNYLIGDTFLAEGAETLLYSDTLGYIVKKDTVFSLSVNNTSTAQAYSYVTPDIVGLSPKSAPYTDPYDKSVVDYTMTTKRYLKLNVEMAGSGDAAVFYSDDFGRTYQPFAESPIVLTGGSVTYPLDLDVSSRQIRYKITNTGLTDNISVTYANTEFLPGSEN